jgi:transcriptional regulator with XRE-family HTH domain
MHVVRSPVGEVLRVARARRGHGQREASAAVGVTQAAWGKWERGATEPAARHLPVLAAYCELTVPDLIGGRAHDGAAEVARLRALVHWQDQQIQADRRRIEELTSTLLELLRERRAPAS